MPFSQDYVLVLDEQESQHHQSELPGLLADLYPFVVTSSVEQAVEQAQRMNPCLVILVGEDPAWFEHRVKALRQSDRVPTMTIVALTESESPRWQKSEPPVMLDGFLVQPLTDDILVSLVQSAIIKQSYQAS
ncbi:MAG: hypothetical protein ACFBSG_04180 [Leptolyngbyaceae cyanobacterium]